MACAGHAAGYEAIDLPTQVARDKKTGALYSGAPGIAHTSRANVRLESRN